MSISRLSIIFIEIQLLLQKLDLFLKVRNLLKLTTEQINGNTSLFFFFFNALGTCVIK